MSQINTKQAFSSEIGQYICHIYIDIEDDQLEDEFLNDDFIKLVQENPIHGKQIWFPKSTSQAEDDYSVNKHFHISLLRGHHALYYHQIKPLISDLTDICKDVPSFNLLLDKLVIFSNYERTKRFLCIAAAKSNRFFDDLRRIVEEHLGQYAVGLTAESEINENIPHCSVMWHDIETSGSNFDITMELQRLENILQRSHLADISKCVNVKSITASIGCKTYTIPLKIN